MPKTTAPLLSFGASGQIAKTAVFAKWKGRPYVRQYAIPSNPNTAEQQLTRGAFSFLQSVWKVSPAEFQAPWTAYARGKVLTNRNAFTKFNLPVLRGETDLANFVFSPGALGGLPPSAVATTPGADSLSVLVTAPATLPSGWTITKAIVAAIADQDPESGILYDIAIGEDLTSTYTVVLSSLDEVLYRVGAWFEWLRPDGQVAYSPSISSSGTPT